MPRTIKISAFLMFALFLVGCGQDAGNEAETEALVAGSASPAVTLTYEKNVRQRACEAMPIELVVQLFEIPVEQIEPSKSKRGCRYGFETEDQTFYAELSSIRVFDDLKKTKHWYGNLTQDASREDIDAQKEELDRRLENQKSLDSKTAKSTAKGLTSMMAALTPEGGLKHKPVEGLGDEAKIDNQDGTLRIRSGNMIFYLDAYNGPRKSWGGSTKLDEIMAEERAWKAKTMPDRTQAVIKLAREVVPLMEKLAN